jgi:excisionase family DNA binding protein
MTTSETETLLTPGEIAAHLRLSVGTVRRYLRDGRIRGFTVFREWRVYASELAAFERRQARVRALR